MNNNNGIGALGDEPSELELSENQPRSSEGFEDIFENAPIGVFQSSTRRILRVNRTLARMFGYDSPAALVGGVEDPERLYVNPEQRRKLFQATMEAKDYVQEEVQFHRKDGSWFTVMLQIRAVRYSSGEVKFLEGFVEDITRRKESEHGVKAAQVYSEMLLQSSPIGIVTCRKTGEVVSANEALARMMGAALEELIAQNVLRLDSWRNSGLESIARGSLQSGQPQKAVIRHLSTFGKDVWVSVQFVPFNHQGEQHLLGLFIDITETKKAEDSLRDVERFAQSTLDSLSAHIAILDHTGCILAVNRSWRHFAAQNRPVNEGVCEGANYLKICDTVTGEDAASAKAFAQGIRSVLAGGTPEFSLEYPCHSPSENRWFVARVSRFLGEGPIRVVVAHENITARKLVEEALQESEQKFRQLVENTNIVFWVCDKQTSKMLYISPAYEQVWGRSCESLYQDSRSFTKAIHADDRPRVLRALERETRGEGYEEEYRILRPDGSMRWIHDRSFIVRNLKGEFYRLAGLAEDITERRELEQQLRQAQKMEAIGQLAGGVAHDFNNILAATLMHLGLLQQNPQLTPGTKDELKEVECEVVRAASLTRQLLLFSRRQVARVEPLEMNGLITELLKMLKRILGENVKVDFQCPSPAMWVQADAGMAEQVVMNLCLNARDAMPKGGCLTLTTALIERSADSGRPHLDARSGRFIRLTVTDTGCGMDETVLKRIFEPFFTTKEVGKGTGLGLATVHGIMKQHDGWVEVESVVGKGSSFQVYFPAHLEGQPLRPVSQKEEIVCGGSETILLVEDDLAVRRTAALCLRKLGYAVIEASNGNEALTNWKENKNRIQLLLTDMVMPEEMTGLELAECLKAEKPSLKIIISSGYSPDLVKPESFGKQMYFLAKPFKALNLARTVRKCLDQKTE